MKIKDLQKYKKILILGYGKEGRATHRFLKKFHPKAKIGIADMVDGADYLKKQKNYDLVIKTPGIPKELVTVPYTTATNIFFANVQNKIIGVTGTKGKSTSASLIYWILKKAGKRVHLIGNIGKPMLHELLRKINKEELFVCELSSYQLDDIKYSPHIALILDLYPEHMNYHGNVENYYLAKKNIATHLKTTDYFFYNPRFKILEALAQKLDCSTVPFKERIDFKAKEIPLIGEHNHENIAACVEVAKIFDIDDETIIKAVKSFRPLPHRLQLIGTYKKIIFYDDAISTTPQSTIFAIKTLKKIGTIFLGGEDRGYDFSELATILAEEKIKNIILFPESGQKIKSLLVKKSKYKPQILETKDMKKAVEFAYKNTQEGFICLLSTASPSYSVWKNFEEKGDLFQFEVKKKK